MSLAPRVFVVIVMLGVVAAGCLQDSETAVSVMAERASNVESMLAAPPGSDVTPTGRVREFDLYLHPMPQHEVYPGATMGMWGFSLDPDPATATVPGPTLRVTEGDTVVVRLQSTVAGFNHTLHFHGQNVPWDMDGVPYVSQDPVEPGEAFTYTFTAKPAGTYWYHCHVDAQHHVDMGMYGVLIVDPQDPAEDPAFDKEFVMVLDDMDRFHLEGGQPAAGNAPQSGDPSAYEEWLRRQAGDTVNRNSQVSERVTGSPVRPARDWYPVTYAPYTADYNTFLINGVSFPYTEPLVVAEDDVIRIRFVNVGNSLFTMHLHGHHVLVTHKDGVLLDAPYWADVVPVAPGERYDVYARMDNAGVWDFHSHTGSQTTNDDIFPGGAMTMLCYEDISETCTSGDHGHDHGRLRAGELLRSYDLGG